MTKLPKNLYHGSCAKLSVGDKLTPRENYDSDMTKRLSAVFATPDMDYAKSFAITSAIHKHGMIWVTNHTMTTQKLKSGDEINRKFYVFELGADGFELDARNEYLFIGEKEILAVHEFDLLDEIKNKNLTIYEFDEFDLIHDNQMSTNEKKDFFDNVLKNKKYHQVDIEKLIKGEE